MNEYDIEEKNINTKKIAWLSLGLLFVAIVVAIVYYETKINKPASEESRVVNFSVAKGSSTRKIAEDLTAKKLISSENVFIIYSYLNGAKSKMQAGEYELNTNMPITEIVDALTAGKVITNSRRFTIIEGWTNKQIASSLESRNIVSQEDFNKALSLTDFDFKYNDLGKIFSYQGFLFPDTYEVAKDISAHEIIQKMLTNFQNKISAHIDSKIIILASIIEKEVGRNKENLTDEDLITMQQERLLVASVFYNRLAIGMPLESDATVNYVTGKADRSPLLTDTRVKSPYNTYVNRGLPPTPISNPGFNSIQAAVSPAQSDYLFFLNEPDGTAHFAKTLAEHNANRAKYLR